MTILKNIEEVIKTYKSNAFDEMDISRLTIFISEENIYLLGLELDEEYKGKHVPIEFTKENVLKQLEQDVRFGFDKAFEQRGISKRDISCCSDVELDFGRWS